VANTNAVTTAVKSTLGTAADVTNAADQAQTILAPLENIQTMTLYSLIGAIGAGAVIILLTMIMIVRERRREVGILKAIGGSNVKVVGQFMAEATTLTIIGSTVGLLLGVMVASPITQALVSSAGTGTTSQVARGGFGGALGRAVIGNANLGAVNAIVGWNVILYGLLIAIGIALVGSAAAAFLIAKVRPAEVMRAE
jgi:putative ABC transport system permease protein